MRSTLLLDYIINYAKYLISPVWFREQFFIITSLKNIWLFYKLNKSYYYLNFWILKAGSNIWALVNCNLLIWVLSLNSEMAKHYYR